MIEAVAGRQASRRELVQPRLVSFERIESERVAAILPSTQGRYLVGFADEAAAVSHASAFAVVAVTSTPVPAASEPLPAENAAC